MESYQDSLCVSKAHDIGVAVADQLLENANHSMNHT